MKVLRSLMTVATLVVATTTAHAQTWPNGPLRMIVPFPAAGQTDLLGRAFADALKNATGVPVVVENKTGAGGTSERFFIRSTSCFRSEMFRRGLTADGVTGRRDDGASDERAAEDRCRCEINPCALSREWSSFAGPD